LSQFILSWNEPPVAPPSEETCQCELVLIAIVWFINLQFKGWLVELEVWINQNPVNCLFVLNMRPSVT